MAKKEPKVECLPCSYCEFFHTTQKRYQGGSIRECPKTKKEKNANSLEPDCEYFKLHRYLWCPEFKKRFINTVCSGRHAVLNPCKKCDIGTAVREQLILHPELSGTYEPKRQMPKIDSPQRLVKKSTFVYEPIRKPRKEVPVTLQQPKKRRPILISKRTNKISGITSVTEGKAKPK